MTLHARTLILAGGRLFVFSTALPVVASMLRNPAPGWLGIADMTVSRLIAA
jgi:hypothetical protein